MLLSVNLCSMCHVLHSKADAVVAPPNKAFHLTAGGGQNMAFFYGVCTKIIARRVSRWRQVNLAVRP